MPQQTKRVALVTGGSRGIGLGTAESLAASGFDLAINDVHDATDVASALVAIQNHGAEVVYCPGTIAEPADRQAIVDAVRTSFGRLDVLVNSADIAPNVPNDVMQASEESFDQLMAVSLKGPYFLTQLMARWMIDERKADENFRGVVINISPIMAREASINRSEYCIIKAGMAMATQLWAHRLAEFGIAVYEVRPGLIRTEMDPPIAEKYDRMIAGGLLVENRWGLPEDVGRTVAMLARGDITYGTGNVLNIDGGLTLRRL